eukprot:CAMPEP_0174324934 /NCGR_PEP_ID=MMETSP0810-20121108/12860_1 /TAXON_ID=73025 ORGANISM="Eutreptiella gymnastica-like, Strain CCMP1594" /NCGR_SAMPLE_ID=MMETSP0810 /ASSEMBLY_ACC=CAM_ASM_000659 /LENGTH=45 /DNA_ID= /DNA_START= /DNA_END= /DNA_ORIENTATION=
MAQSNIHDPSYCYAHVEAARDEDEAAKPQSNAAPAVVNDSFMGSS